MIFSMTVQETVMTSHKPLTDKMYELPISHIDKQRGLEYFTEPPRLDCLTPGIGIESQD